MSCQLGGNLLAQQTRRKPREKGQKGWLVELIDVLYPVRRLKRPDTFICYGFDEEAFFF